MEQLNPSILQKMMAISNIPLINQRYLHWDKLQHHKVEGYTAEEYGHREIPAMGR